MTPQPTTSHQLLCLRPDFAPGLKSGYATLLTDLRAYRKMSLKPLGPGKKAWQRTELQHIFKIGILATKAGVDGEEVLLPKALWDWIERKINDVAKGRSYRSPSRLVKNTMSRRYVELTKAALALAPASPAVTSSPATE